MELLLMLWLNLQFNLKQAYCMVVVCTPQVVAQEQADIAKPINSSILFQNINSWRIENGYKPYKESNLTCEVAHIRAREASENYSHDKFIAERFCTNCILSENLIIGLRNEEITLNSWLISPAHRENLEKNYPYSCIAIENNMIAHIFSYQ